MNACAYGKRGRGFVFLIAVLGLFSFSSASVQANEYGNSNNQVLGDGYIKSQGVALKSEARLRRYDQSTLGGEIPMRVYIPIVMCEAMSPPQIIEITNIFFDGIVPQSESDEYAEIANLGSRSVNLEDWRLNAGEPSQDFTFPEYWIAPGQSCRVYTNEIHPESCGFSFASGVALWNNEDDCGYLYNKIGNLISRYCY